jgi:LmbE family N-acetylglucosaminyl deacetylase
MTTNKVKDSYHKIFTNKKRVLVIMPHPDDAELYCGGTISKLIIDGISVQVVKMTLGEKGCKQEKISENSLKNIRKSEDKESMRVLGVKNKNNIYLDLGDGKIEENLDMIGIIAEKIRLFQPDLIITTNPQDMIIRFSSDASWINHRDHINTGKIAMYASYPYARDISFFTEHFKNPNAKSHICSEFLFTDFYNTEDNVYIDVKNTLMTRIKAHACHKSQYTTEQAKDSAEFFTGGWENGKNFETFKHVVVD